MKIWFVLAHVVKSGAFCSMTKRGGGNPVYDLGFQGLVGIIYDLAVFTAVAVKTNFGRPKLVSKIQNFTKFSLAENEHR